MSTITHPCQRCGACCAAYRVAFHWAESEHAVFAGHIDTLRKHEVSLRQIEENGHPRCVFLHGDIGTQVACSIYEQRPSPCRAVTASLQDGQSRDVYCDRARERHGLLPLTLQDWKFLQDSPWV